MGASYENLFDSYNKLLNLAMDSALMDERIHDSKELVLISGCKGPKLCQAFLDLPGRYPSYAGIQHPGDSVDVGPDGAQVEKP